MAGDCSVFGVYHPEILRTIFADSYLDFLERKHNLDDWLLFNRLYRMVQSECPRHLEPFPRQALIDKAFEIESNYYRTNYTGSTLFRNDLQTGVGGAAFLKNSMFTKLGFHMGTTSAI